MTRNKKPNILLIMTDQLRFDAIGDGAFGKTPALDQLAADGIAFTACYANAPVCIPSRFSLATGASVSELGIYDNIAVDLNPGLHYWTNTIKEDGYQTAVIGKTHLHRHHGDLREREHLIRSYGFDFVDEISGPRASAFVQSNMTDLWEQAGVLEDYKKDLADRFESKPHVARPSVLPSELYADNYVGDVANKYLESVDCEQPWLCWVSFGGPHEPWDAPQEYCDRFSDLVPPAAIPFSESEFQVLPRGSLHFSKHDEAVALEAEDVAELRTNYAANVALIDDRVQDLVSTLKSRKVYDQTLIVFTSDHGEMNGDHGLLYKNVLYEQAVKVPLVIVPNLCANSIKRGSVSAAKVQLSDIGQTILDLCAIESKQQPLPQYGKSFANLFDPNVADTHREYIFSEVADDILVFDGRWKLILDKKSGGYMMFDLKNDPHEQKNQHSNPLYYFVRRRLVNAVHKFMRRNIATQ